MNYKRNNLRFSSLHVWTLLHFRSINIGVWPATLLVFKTSVGDAPSKMDGVPTVPCAHKSRTEQPVSPKRLVVCCDGTWNNSNVITGPQTNVSSLVGAVAHKCCSGMPQVVHYHPGAGTEAHWMMRQQGGIFGLGVVQDIVEIYRFICDNYNSGDEIILIGFSRGAFTARSVANMICELGFLNRAGLDQLPFIFRDYQELSSWKDQAYKKTEHLAGFTLENFERVKRFEAWRTGTTMRLTREQIAEELDAEKEGLFKIITGISDTSSNDPSGNDPSGHHKATEEYRKMLAKQEMCLLDKNYGPGEVRQKVPLKGHVRAVGVWDTVGSLGFPRTAWRNCRQEQEVRFASLEVHPNVEFAFQALALDEWRTAFVPTMWCAKGSPQTKIRQVWFPGSHANVGGGWEDQQIATIALAWMADQLTSIGMELKKYEMRRIFHSVNPLATVRPWGMGKINNPSLKSAVLTKVHQYITMPYNAVCGASTDVPIRTPGMYEEENGRQAHERLQHTHEFVHPSVRIRYIYDGKGLDDVDYWACRALTENGYRLVPQKLSQSPVPPDAHDINRDSHADSALTEYRTVAGVLIPYFDSSRPPPDRFATEDRDSVNMRRYLVQVERPEADDLQELRPPVHRWVWEQVSSKGEKQLTLFEEQIGIWERMFMKINDKLLRWQQQQNPGQEEIEILSGWFGWWKGAKPAKPMPDPAMYPAEYCCHDILTWPNSP